MAKLWVSEFASLAKDGLGNVLPLASEPALANQQITFTTASASAAFSDGTTIVRLIADTDCRVRFGAAPVAVTTDERLVADTEYWRRVSPGQKVSVYDGIS